MAQDVDPELTVRIAEAREELAVAQRELEAVLSDLKDRERADKTMISQILRDVLDKVSTAKRKLDAIV